MQRVLRNYYSNWNKLEKKNLSNHKKKNLKINTQFCDESLKKYMKYMVFISVKFQAFCKNSFLKKRDF